MRYPGLAATFRNLVLIAAAAVPATGCVPPGSGGCEDVLGEVALMEPLDAELQALVDACRGQDDCLPMCIELIERQREYAWDDSYEVVTACEIDESRAIPRATWAYAPECVGGRRPDGYAAAGCDLGTVGGYFAEQARLEAASVLAFDDLARALAAHRAPRLLIDACRRAAADEAVHAVLCARIARRHGVEPRLLRATPAKAKVPTLEALALANAVEGCVREGWAALIATWQAGAAGDPQIRAAMQRIAPDETRHATLSRAVDRWARRRLDADAIGRIDAARAHEIAALAAGAAQDVPVALARAAGLPDAAISARLMAGMRAAAWAA